MAARQVTIQFLGDAKSFVSSVDAAGRSTDTFGHKLKSIGKAALIGFGGAAVVAGKAMYDMADAAIEDQKSASLLANTLKNTTGATKDQVSAMESWISTQGQLYGVADDDLRPALSKLATATGDLTKTQQLASLAMNVSAGAQKDLQSVAQSLSKAYSTGSVAALSKYQVATKNADGSTKSLAQVTDELTAKYKGDAAKAADTVAGKFARVKLELSETAESIGYKLLPVADDLGDWLVKDGIPGLERLGNAARHELGPDIKDLTTWVSENKGEMEDLGQEVLSVLIPAIKGTVGVVGDAVHLFGELPGPVKQVGVEVGIAAVAFPKLNAVMTGLKLQEFATGLGSAEERTAALGKAARTAAGIGGLAALAQSTSESNDALSALEGVAGGAAVGFSMGGPWGALIGGAGGGLISAFRHLSGSTDDVSDSFKGAKTPAKDYASTLDDVSGAASDATKKMILLDLQQQGVIESGSKLGLTTRDLVGQVLGNADAQKRVAAAFKAANKDASQVQVVYGSLGQVTKLGTERQREMYDALASVKSGLGFTKRSLKDQIDATRDAALVAEDLSSVYKNFPKRVATAIDAVGIVPTAKGVADLAVKYDAVDNRHIKALIQATGTDISIKQVQNLIDHMNALHDKTVTITTVTKNTRGGVTSSAGGHSATDPSGRVAAGDVGKLLNLDAYRTSKQGHAAATAFLDGIVQGLHKGQHTVGDAVDKLQSYIQTKNDKLGSLLADKGSFLSSFQSGFSNNLFGAQFTDADGNPTAPTLDSLKQYATQQRDQAQSLAANISKLVSEGLDKDLINQLVSEGQAGYGNIAALASGSAADVAQLNQISADTNAAIGGIGKQLYDTLNPTAEASITLLQSQVDTANESNRLLKHIADRLDANPSAEVAVKGGDIVVAVRHHEQQTGRKMWASTP